MRDETLNLLEDIIVNNLKDIQTDYFPDDDNGFAKKRIINETDMLLTKLLEFEKLNDEYLDKSERHQLEKEKIEVMKAIEDAKNDISPKRMKLELIKLIVPIISGSIIYGILQGRLLKFEETGRLTSFASRELHLPKLPFFK